MKNLTERQGWRLEAKFLLRQGGRNGSGAFTLIELLAVALVILILASLSLPLVSYIQSRMAYQTARAQVAAISAAVENYRSDWGYYPRTLAGRVSSSGSVEATNNWYLYRALAGQHIGSPNRIYMTFSGNILRANSAWPGVINIYDPWGMPYNYYCSPTTPFGIMNTIGWTEIANSPSNYAGYSVGGQVNSRTFDLFSYGPDRFTFVCTCPAIVSPASSHGDTPWALVSAAPWNGSCPWGSPLAAKDDVTNWQQ